MFDDPTSPKQEFLIHATTSHPPTIKALQLEKSKIKLSASPPLDFNRKSLISELKSKCFACSVRKRSRSTEIFFWIANYQVTEAWTWNLVSQNIIYLILSSCSVTLPTFDFPEARQHNFVLKFHIHYLELDKLPLKLQPCSPCMEKTSTESTLAHSKVLHTHEITPSLLSPPLSPSFPKQIQELHEPGPLQCPYSLSNYHKQDF